MPASLTETIRNFCLILTLRLEIDLLLNVYQYFNLRNNCLIQVYYLLNYIVTKCGSKELQIALDTIDLVDVNGDLKNLRNHRVKNEYASSLLTSRAVYILVEIKDGGDTEFPIVTPLLRNSDLLTPKLLTKLESLNHKVTQPHVVPVAAPKPVILKQTKKTKNNAQHLEAS